MKTKDKISITLVVFYIIGAIIGLLQIGVNKDYIYGFFLAYTGFFYGLTMINNSITYDDERRTKGDNHAKTKSRPKDPY